MSLSSGLAASIPFQGGTWYNVQTRDYEQAAVDVLSENAFGLHHAVIHWCLAIVIPASSARCVHFIYKFQLKNCSYTQSFEFLEACS
jgi:hypothetical protein